MRSLKFSKQPPDQVVNDNKKILYQWTRRTIKLREIDEF